LKRKNEMILKLHLSVSVNLRLVKKKKKYGARRYAALNWFNILSRLKPTANSRSQTSR